MNSDVILSAVIVVVVIGANWARGLLQLCAFQETKRSCGMVENPFKVGDTVVCVKPCNDVLPKGSEWVVTGASSQYVELQGAPDGGWYYDRFKLKETAPVVEAPEFKIGDTVVCVDAEGSLGGVVSGKEYRIRSVNAKFVWLEGEQYVGWRNRRFKLKESAVESPEDSVEITDPKAPEPVTNIHCGGPYVAVSEYSRVCVELANERASSGQVIQELRDTCEAHEDHLASLLQELVTVREQLAATVNHRDELIAQQMKREPADAIERKEALDHWAAIVLPAILQARAAEFGLDRTTWCMVAEWSYEMADAMLSEQGKDRQAEQ